MAAKIKEPIGKYGRVGQVVHLAVSYSSLTASYIAIKNNVDVNGLLHLALDDQPPASELPEGSVIEKIEKVKEGGTEEVDRATEIVIHHAGAVALAYLANKALLPVRIPLTVILTPRIHRIWTRTRFFREN